MQRKQTIDRVLQRVLPVVLMVMFSLGEFSGEAQARNQSSLGDFTVSADRIPDFYNYEKPDTSSWRVYDATSSSDASALGCSRATPNDSTDDGPAINCMTQNAPTDSVVFLPVGLYRCDSQSGNACFRIYHAGIILRGAGPGQTIIRSSLSGPIMTVANWQANTGASVSWTGGYARGSQILTVASTSGLTSGQWVRVEANAHPEVSQNTELNYHVRLSCVGGSGTDCQGVGSNQVKIDRPLRMDFNTGNARVTIWNPYERVGLESLTLEYADPANANPYQSGVFWEFVANSWIEDIQFKNGYDSMIYITNVARMSVRRSTFDETHKPNDWNKSAIRMGGRVHDLVFEDNSTHHTAVALEVYGGSSGVVIGYNRFFAPNDPSLPGNHCERSVFFHGSAVWDILIEGNDFSCGMMWDSLWGSPGHRVIFYRNRGRNEGTQSQYTAGAPGSFMFHYDGLGNWQDTNVILDWAFLGNTVQTVDATPPPGVLGVNILSRGQWWERNVIAGICALQQNLGTITTQCAGRNDPPSGAQVTNRYSDVTWRDNVVGTGQAPGSWGSVDIPDSLYRSGMPNWWCQESGTFPNIGAQYDNLSDTGSLGLIPSHRRGRGMACTPPNGFPVPDFLPER